MYIDIKHLKSKGFSNSMISKMLGLSRPTVIKYANMSPEEFRQYMEKLKHRVKKAQKFDKEIVSWLKQYPQMTSAQIFDWLEERYKQVDFNESTIRNYVRLIRDEYDIPKEIATRQYEAFEDPPMGKQMQVDFGEKKVMLSDGVETTLYVMCFVLSHSRFKYCEWQAKPFNTSEIVRIHENAFEYFGGYPEEAVYDQDHIILVSENHGDLIYTGDFAAYLQRRNFSVRMCRKADPESKGRIEKVVDFVKDNFASNRTFYSIDRWNEDCLKWLKRRGNGKIHSSTRKIPAEVFLEEKKYLRPVTNKIVSKIHTMSITYMVRKDNTIPIQGNRYSVPRGTYKGINSTVGVNKIDNKYISILDLDTGKEIARHEIPQTKGNLVVNNDHKRDKSQRIETMLKNMIEKFADKEKARIYLDSIHAEKPRYIRDQLMLIDSVIRSSSSITVSKTLDYCLKNKLFSASDFKDAAEHYSRVTDATDVAADMSAVKGLTEAATNNMAAKAHIRDIKIYAEIMNGNNGGR